jgi:hypothetical protein
VVSSLRNEISCQEKNDDVRSVRDVERRVTNQNCMKVEKSEGFRGGERRLPNEI